MKCPICKKEVAVGNPDLPFCSERCRVIDLGNWAAEKYVISTPVEPKLEEEVMPQAPGAPGRKGFSLSRAVVENGPDKLKLIPQGVEHPPESEALQAEAEDEQAGDSE